MRFLRPLLILSLLPAAALAEVEFGASQGSFPVFGPSAEREAFFAAQEAEREAALEAQRLERERERERLAEQQRLETMREIAEAEARARESAVATRTRLLPCVIAAPGGPVVPGRDLPVPRDHREIRNARTTPPLDPGPGRPGPYPYPPAKPDYPRYAVPCLPTGAVVLPYRPLYPYGSELSVTVDEDGFTGSVTLRRPGVGFGFDF